MLSVRRLGLGCVAAALMSTGGRAISTSGTQVSSAYCKVTATSTASATSQSTFIEAWEDIAVAICDEGSASIDISVQARSVAHAIAEAFAQVVAQCETQGQAEARAQAYAMAQDHAEAIATAISGIWAGITTCGNCEAVVDSYARVSQFLVADAVAEAWTDIYVFSDHGGAPGTEESTITSHILVERISDVIIDISGTMHGAVQDGCSIDLINSITVGDYFSFCALDTTASSYKHEVSAIAQAGADAAAWACDGDIAEAHVTVTARATAEAIAEAIADANIWCETHGADTLACGMTQASIEEVAYAQAESFAAAFATATSCNCDVLAYAEVEFWGEIWAEAAVNAYADTCAAGGDYAIATDFQAQLDERIIAVTAEAIASAVADGGDHCRVSLDVCTSASADCVRTYRKCYGAGYDHVKPCCDDSQKCFKRDDSKGYYCARSAPSFWDGEVVTCVTP